MSKRESVFFNVSSSESLVGDVEEGEELPGLHDSGNLSPLFLCRIHSSRVVGTSLQKHSRSVGSLLQIFDVVVEVQRFCLGVVVPEHFHFVASVLQHVVMIRPCGTSHVDSRCLELLQNIESD